MSGSPLMTFKNRTMTPNDFKNIKLTLIDFQSAHKFLPDPN